LAVAKNGSHFQRAARAAGMPFADMETTLELTYVGQAASWLAIQPDLQYILRPGAAPGLPDALAFRIEFEASF
jgi:porin